MVFFQVEDVARSGRRSSGAGEARPARGQRSGLAGQPPLGGLRDFMVLDLEGNRLTFAQTFE
jgi:hypothetical protein